MWKANRGPQGTMVVNLKGAGAGAVAGLPNSARDEPCTATIDAPCEPSCCPPGQVDWHNGAGCIKACKAGSVLAIDGSCVSGPPPSWSCERDFYGSADGCDCLVSPRRSAGREGRAAFRRKTDANHKKCENKVRGRRPRLRDGPEQPELRRLPPLQLQRRRQQGVQRGRRIVRTCSHAAARVRQVRDPREPVPGRRRVRLRGRARRVFLLHLLCRRPADQRRRRVSIPVTSAAAGRARGLT